MDEAAIVRDHYVRHLVERLEDDSLFHARRCAECEAIIALPLDETLQLIREASASLSEAA